jgi:isoquinoline 1-oxidoreductase beta subunit
MPLTSDTPPSTGRRGFLKLGASTGLLLGITLPGAAQNAAPASFSPNLYLQIGSDGKIIIFSKNPEIGQGVKTSMPQIVAEELEVDWQQIEVQQGLLDAKFGAQFAGGSTGIKSNFDALRKAGACAREMLVEAAARRWNISLDQCQASSGKVVRKDTGAALSYGELAAAAAKLELRDNPRLKDRKDFKIIGKAVPAVDSRAIVSGTAEFGLDARPKGALVAVIARSPVYGGSIRQVDDKAALAVPGVLQVVQVPAGKSASNRVTGVAVVATGTWAAMQGRKALKVEWDNGSAELESSTAHTRQFKDNLAPGKAPAAQLRNDGDVDKAFATCKAVHEALYEAPFLAHATMEPMNYIADVRAESAEVWGPTQVPGSVRADAAAITGLAPAKIKVRLTRSGGGFGRRLMADYASEAIWLSKHLGKPVQVVWTREDDIAHDYFRPAAMFRVKGGLDANKKLVAYHVAGTSTSRRAFSGSSEGHHATEIFPDAFPAGFVPNYRCDYTPVVSKVPRGAWRAPGHNITAWVDQSFADEMAHLAGKDPVEFRLALLGERDRMMPYADHGGPVYSTARLKNVIRLAAAKAGWGKPVPSGQFRGFACHFMFGAYVAEVVTIKMTGPTSYKVEHVLAVVDCGQVINQTGARKQIEGGINDGLSAALHQAVHIEGGRAVESNFHDYPLLRMMDAPKIDVHLVDSDAPPEGLGEMSLPPLAAALCNAIYAATGKRIRSLPIKL